MDKQAQNGFTETTPVKPFVNEECGDTMWDAVLQQAEETLANKVGPSSVDIKG